MQYNPRGKSDKRFITVKEQCNLSYHLRGMG